MSLPQPDDGVLRKAQRGDDRAFAIIVRSYQTPVYNYVLRMVGDRSLAEDLTQEVFLRVYQGLPRFSERSKFTTWLFQVTKNRVLDELRAVERAGGVSLVIADHGNAETLLQADGVSPHTAHTTNPVPLVLTAPGLALREGELSDLAPTALALLGLDPPPEMSGRNVVANG